jgi:hypothetical protein
MMNSEATKVQEGKQFSAFSNYTSSTQKTIQVLYMDCRNPLFTRYNGFLITMF